MRTSTSRARRSHVSAWSGSRSGPMSSAIPTSTSPRARGNRAACDQAARSRSGGQTTRLTTRPMATPTQVSSSRLHSRLDSLTALVASTTIAVVATEVDSSPNSREPAERGTPAAASRPSPAGRARGAGRRPRRGRPRRRWPPPAGPPARTCGRAWRARPAPPTRARGTAGRGGTRRWPPTTRGHRPARSWRSAADRPTATGRAAGRAAPSRQRRPTRDAPPRTSSHRHPPVGYGSLARTRREGLMRWSR